MSRAYEPPALSAAITPVSRDILPCPRACAFDGSAWRLLYAPPARRACAPTSRHSAVIFMTAPLLA